MENLSVLSILKKSKDKAINGGLSGAAAMSIQVGSLMWMRTTMNYQFKNGGTFLNTLSTLYKEGGIPRFYRGVVPALMVGPIARFGDTAMNDGVMTFFKYNENLKETPIFIQTGCASVLAGLWRIGTIPIDTWKTSKQVHGKDGLKVIFNKIKMNGPTTMYHGALASSFATMVGHYPWFTTYNYLNSYLPKYRYDEETLKALSRNALIGFSASFVSDTISNSVRVVKTIKQTNSESITYPNAVKQVIAQDGIKGLLFRGLGTKILTNGLQGIIFSISWRFISEKMN
jgi:hypothetical protein